MIGQLQWASRGVRGSRTGGDRHPPLIDPSAQVEKVENHAHHLFGIRDACTPDLNLDARKECSAGTAGPLDRRNPVLGQRERPPPSVVWVDGAADVAQSLQLGDRFRDGLLAYAEGSCNVGHSAVSGDQALNDVPVSHPQAVETSSLQLGDDMTIDGATRK